MSSSIKVHLPTTRSSARKKLDTLHTLHTLHNNAPKDIIEHSTLSTKRDDPLRDLIKLLIKIDTEYITFSDNIKIEGRIRLFNKNKSCKTSTNQLTNIMNYMNIILNTIVRIYNGLSDTYKKGGSKSIKKTLAKFIKDSEDIIGIRQTEKLFYIKLYLYFMLSLIILLLNSSKTKECITDILTKRGEENKHIIILINTYTSDENQDIHNFFDNYIINVKSHRLNTDKNISEIKDIMQTSTLEVLSNTIKNLEIDNINKNFESSVLRRLQELKAPITRSSRRI